MKAKKCFSGFIYLVHLIEDAHRNCPLTQVCKSVYEKKNSKVSICTSLRSDKQRLLKNILVYPPIISFMIIYKKIVLKGNSNTWTSWTDLSVKLYEQLEIFAFKS